MRRTTSAAGLRRCGFGLVLGACCALAGCAGEDRTPMAVRDPVIQDIPKPQDFRLVDKNSQAYNSGQYRIAKCEYLGPAKPVDIVRFYEQNMPAAGFELLTRGLDRGTYTLQFESAAETCMLRISPSAWRTRINLELGPKPGGAAPRPSASPSAAARRPD